MPENPLCSDIDTPTLSLNNLLIYYYLICPVQKAMIKFTSELLKCALSKNISEIDIQPQQSTRHSVSCREARIDENSIVVSETRNALQILLFKQTYQNLPWKTTQKEL